MPVVHAYAAAAATAAFEPFTYELPELGPGEVDVRVEHCGICHSDLSMLNNDWGITAYPFVGGHEAVGTIESAAPDVPNLRVGDRVGVGWYSRSCTHCRQCLGGDHHRCSRAEATIVARHGGFADRVRAHWTWTVPIPPVLDVADAGPLFCGGITAFTPLLQHRIRPTQRVGVIGIGGLGHLAVQFADKWGCEVTAFSGTPDKQADAEALGADHFVHTRDADAMKRLAGSLDLILNTTNVALPWDDYLAALAPGGVLHTVGVTPTFGLNQPFPLIEGQKSLSGSPLGRPADLHDMLGFCARHGIKPVTQHLAMADINQAFDALRAGTPRYRLVLDA